MKTKVLALVTVFALWASAASAATISINFDGAAAPVLFGSSTALTTQLSGSGVTWNGGGAILDEGSNFGVTGYSSPNFLAYNSNASFQNGDAVQNSDILFLNGTASGVSFYVGNDVPGLPSAVFFATAYNSLNAVVDSVAGLNLVAAVQAVTLSGLGIVRVDYGLSTGESFVLDDLEVRDFAAIPEPATLLLLGTGLAAAGMRRRMKKRG